MANWNDPQPNRTGFGSSSSQNGPILNGEAIGRAGVYDQGLRRHMLSIYNYMASGVLLSGMLDDGTSGLAASAVLTSSCSTGSPKSSHQGRLAMDSPSVPSR